MIPGIYTYLATGTIAGALSFGAGWQIQSWKYGEKIEDMKLATSNEVIEALRRNKVLTETITAKYQEALNESRAREVTLRRNVAVAVAVAVRESDRLREQASEAARRIARENAEREIWPLLGFRLRDELARPVLTDYPPVSPVS